MARRSAENFGDVALVTATEEGSCCMYVRPGNLHATANNFIKKNSPVALAPRCVPTWWGPQ